MSKLNIYQKISKLRLDFLNANVKKTGVNRFAEYKYFELADIVPVVLPLCEKYGLVTLFDFTDDMAYMQVVDTDAGVSEEFGVSSVTFRSPMRTLTVKGMNEIQALGGVETYQRRYLYMMFLDIVEQDAFYSTNGKPDTTEAKTTKPATTTDKPKSNRPATPKERDDAKKELINEGGQATELQIKSIKNGLKKLREKDEKAGADAYDAYITATIKRVKGSIDKKAAEALLIEIGKKIEE